MFKKVLIANRGEIALRVIRACRELGVQTVAVYSEADRESLHVRFADDDVCIGPPPSRSSYLKIPNIIAAAEITGADAIHPGYGFLAENAEFAETCKASNITFIGPTGDQIRQMGDKATARRLAKEAGVPTVPGTAGHDRGRGRGDGRGHRDRLSGHHQGHGRRRREGHAHRPRRRPVPPALRTGPERGAVGVRERRGVRREVPASTPATSRSRSWATTIGKVVHMGERDCSVQRRHQKLIEESPSPALTDELREQMGEAAVALASNIGYSGAGTIEFLLDPDGKFYFMEMNTRIQVEHPVTEMVTSFDIVKEQIRVASGEPVSFQGDGTAAARPRDRVPHQRRRSLPELSAFSRPHHGLPSPGRARVSGWIPTSTPGIRCRRTTTRCSPR